MGHVNEPGRRGRQGASSGAAEASQREQALDDWLDDISDDDWDATAHGIPRAASPVDQGVGVPEGDNWADPSVDRPAPTRFGARDEAHQAVVERRRIVAGLVVVVVVGLGVATSVLLLRDGNETPVVTTIEPTTGTTQAPTETSPPTTTPTPSPSPPATTTPATADAFTLPEGTKLQLGEETTLRSCASSSRPCPVLGTTPVRPTEPSAHKRRRPWPRSRRRTASPSTVGSAPRPRRR